MIERLLELATEPRRQGDLRAEAAAHAALLRASAGRGRRDAVLQAEDVVRVDPAAAFTFDATGAATLKVPGATWSAGRFETQSIATLRERATQAVKGLEPGRARLWIFDGVSPLTDIGALQATSTDTLFQVASQFNCLESPGRYVTRVANYFNDNTQGPRASISAFPGTLLRHYAAPHGGGGRFVQKTDGAQIDLLADACGPDSLDNGYFTGKGLHGVTVRLLEDHFDAIRVGVHNDVQAVLGYDWDGAIDGAEARRIAQVFTSTVAGGGYGGETYLDEAFEFACRQLLRAAYLGTLLAAVCLGRRTVVLTLIGGGVFRNPVPLIWESIVWALDQVEMQFGVTLDVIVNGRSIGQALDLDSVALPDARARDGAILAFDLAGIVSVRR